MSSKLGTSSPGKRNSSSVPDSPSKKQKKNSGGLKVSPKKDYTTRESDISLRSRRQLFQPTHHDAKQEKSETLLKPSGTTDASEETRTYQSDRGDQSNQQQQVSTGQGCVVNLHKDDPVPEKSDGVKNTGAIGQLP